MPVAHPKTMALQQLQKISLSLTDAFFISVALAAVFQVRLPALLHGDCAELLHPLAQGMFLVLAAEYYRLFGRTEGERTYMRVYVATLLVLSTIYLSLNITVRSLPPL